MKKSLKKTVNYLTKYIGKEIVRTKPAVYFTGVKDLSYMNRRIELVGFTAKGTILYKDLGLGDHISEMPIEFTDRNYITYKKAVRNGKHPLRKWVGKEITRIRPTATCGDRSYMGESVKLVSCSKHHMVINWKEGSFSFTSLLGEEFMAPDDWKLA